jgi:hypothetical protein
MELQTVMLQSRTTAVNLRSSQYDVYIGRGSPFGNRYRIGAHGTRAEVIESYRTAFLKRIEIDPSFAAEVRALWGKRLGCYCKPLACHGDVIVEWLNEQVANEARPRLIPLDK